MLKYFPGVGNYLVWPNLVCGQRYRPDPVTEAEDYQLCLGGRVGFLSFRRRWWVGFLYWRKVEPPADGQAFPGLEAGNLVFPVRSCWPGEMDA